MQIAEFAAMCYPHGSIVLQANQVYICLSASTTRENDLLGTLPPSKLINPVIKLRQQILDRLRRAVIQHKPELISLIPGPRLRTPRQIFSIRRVGRREIAARRSAHLHRLRRSVGQVKREDIGIGAYGRLGIEILSKRQLLRILRKGKPTTPTQRKRRHVMRIVRRQIAHCTALNRNEQDRKSTRLNSSH